MISFVKLCICTDILSLFLSNPLSHTHMLHITFVRVKKYYIEYEVFLLYYTEYVLISVVFYTYLTRILLEICKHMFLFSSKNIFTNSNYASLKPNRTFGIFVFCTTHFAGKCKCINVFHKAHVSDNHQYSIQDRKSVV